jgi:hypothetical protein
MACSNELIDAVLHVKLDNFSNCPFSKKVMFIPLGFDLLCVFRVIILEPVFQFLPWW